VAPRTRTPIGGALHSASSDLSDVGATDRLLVWRSIRRDPPPQSDSTELAECPLARQAPRDPTHAQYAGVENVSRSFPTHREPQQSTRFGPIRNNSSSRSKDGTFLMRLPSELGCYVRASRALLLSAVIANPPANWTKVQLNSVAATS
jgi:hypothetical protein